MIFFSSVVRGFLKKNHILAFFLKFLNIFRTLIFYLTIIFSLSGYQITYYEVSVHKNKKPNPSSSFSWILFLSYYVYFKLFFPFLLHLAHIFLLLISSCSFCLYSPVIYLVRNRIMQPFTLSC